MSVPLDKPHKALGDLVNKMIASGDFHVILSALKAFRNGVVYGTRVRAPHALVLNLVWGRGPLSGIPRKIFEVTKTHAVGLGCSGLLFTLVRVLLRQLQGGRVHMWHHMLGGFLVGCCFWGDASSGIHQQMLMYLLARNICSLYQLLMEKYATFEMPACSYRIFMGVLWATVLTLFMHAPTTQQASLRHSLQYIYLDSAKYTSWYDLFVVNSAETL
ncbi:peroxisomal membrane protein 4 [Strigomonas culicis]|uniref:Peroxisomal membrane protein 4 n=1 Tax=Strigomonas culicis TaxID=28005 RepID=S9UFP3_9TRYP|nr:peroxisomal membrane protein 4 [Strigomonas culicis]EPY36331.1 peroxisomal membrane protein 4 [Strigomonas culicis]|eukprot:EPY29622.1 peroxisomal membrane protein 4 [Strigomonas culicis]